jgi:glycosyltransferase involved in cell wall biosynthesis
MVDGSDPAETAGAICRLLDDPAEARRLGSAARAMAERDFSWDSIYNLYRKALLNRV